MRLSFNAIQGCKPACHCLFFDLARPYTKKHCHSLPFSTRKSALAIQCHSVLQARLLLFVLWSCSTLYKKALSFFAIQHSQECACHSMPFRAASPPAITLLYLPRTYIYVSRARVRGLQRQRINILHNKYLCLLYFVCGVAEKSSDVGAIEVVTALKFSAIVFWASFGQVYRSEVVEVGLIPILALLAGSRRVVGNYSFYAPKVCI